MPILIKKKDGGQPSRTLYILQGRRCLQVFVVARVSMPCTSWSSHTAAEAAKEKEQKVIKIGLLAAVVATLMMLSLLSKWQRLRKISVERHHFVCLFCCQRV